MSRSRKRKQKRSRNTTKEPRIEFQETTMQMPYGIGSVFWAVENGILTAAEGMTVAFTTRFSNWNKGKSHIKSYSQIAKALAISKEYVKRLIKKVADWLKAIKVTRKGKLYEITSHVVPPDTPEEDMPYDKSGNLMKFAVPIKTGAPFEKMVAGKISWQSCWLWLVMKLHSTWDGNDEKAGQTNPLSYVTLERLTRLSPSVISRCLKELTKMQMIERLSEPHLKGVYQLYPKPPRTALKRGHSYSEGVIPPKTIGKYIYSYNFQYRIHIFSSNFQMKRKLSDAGVPKWVDATREQIPDHIRIDLEQWRDNAFDGIQMMKKSLEQGTSNSNPITPNSNPIASYSNPIANSSPDEPSDGLPF